MARLAALVILLLVVPLPMLAQTPDTLHTPPDTAISPPVPTPEPQAVPAPTAPQKTPIYKQKLVLLGGGIITFLVIMYVMISWYVDREFRDRERRHNQHKS